MQSKSKFLNELNRYVEEAPRWQLPLLRIQCVHMINRIDQKLYGKSKPIKIHWWQKLFFWRKNK